LATVDAVKYCRQSTDDRHLLNTLIIQLSVQCDWRLGVMKRVTRSVCIIVGGAVAQPCVNSHWLRSLNLRYITARLLDRISARELSRQLGVCLSVWRQGRVVTLETVTVPIPRSSGKPDSGVTRWTESVGDDTANAFILRLFYITDVAGGGSSSSSSSRPLGELGLSASLHIMFAA